jgi:hypothetical protein
MLGRTCLERESHFFGHTFIESDRFNLLKPTGYVMHQQV